MKKISITLFASRSREGQAFARRLSRDIESIVDSQDFHSSLFHIIEQGTQYDMISATLHDDLVIFDGSQETDVNGNWCSNYEAVLANVISNDNIAVVSRTVLPINYMPFRTNVPAFGTDEHDYTGQFTDDSLLEWLKATIRSMKKEGRFPKPASLTFDLPPFGRITSENIDSIMERANRITQENSDYIHRSRSKAHSAFISYRSYYYRHTFHGWNVEKLAEYIRCYHDEQDGAEWHIRYYPSGVLSSEVMPEYRRWGFLSYVDRTLRSSDEVWIFQTPAHQGEAGYYDSWWTQGEIVSLMYIKKYNPQQMPAVYLFDPVQGQARKMPLSFIPDLPAESSKELVRYFSNSDFLSGSMELLAPMRQLRSLSDEELARFLPYLNSYMQTVMRGFSEKDLMEDHTVASLRDSLSSHTYDLSFVENRILVCPYCFGKGRTIEDMRHPAFLSSYLRVNCDEAPSRVKGVHIITPEKMEQIVQTGRWECPGCHHSYRIQENKSILLTQWWAIRTGQHTGPDGCVVERIPAYEINPI